ncbi:MAG: glycerol-3-phosphate dehydrogenase/oxidase [Opitutus sp.]|nr:glycerol-3-phosphate dehydrogenase/oxidase [Opitutus sp.]
MQFPPRSSLLHRLRALRTVDVLIIGGGINGAGVLRDLAANGVDALLADRADFSAGATSASSRMIHGGLRYLENGEFRLVRESLHERNRLLHHAPHAVKPLPTTIPIFSRWSGLSNALEKFLGRTSRPAKRGAFLIKIGLTLYEWFSGRDQILPRHAFTRRAEALRQRPLLHPGIVCTATYYDAWIPLPERLCLEIIDDAGAAHPGAVAANYVGVVRLTGDGGVVLRDEVSGEEFTVRPRVVVNATGAWVDFTNDALATPTRFIGGTKGSHLVVDHPELLAATRGQQIFYENEDGRICIFFPVHGRVLVGSTDIRLDDPSQAVCDDSEIEYLLESVRTVFPAIVIGREHILARFCGVRPLPRSEAGFTGRISRDHACRDLPPDVRRPWPLHSLVGGKWTTFRAFAEEVTDRVLAELGRSRRASTRDLAIGGRTPEADLESPAALRALLATEAVVHLDDLLLRRTPLALYGRLTAEKFAAIAALAADVLGWDAARLAAEKNRARQILFTRHGVDVIPATTAKN